MAIKQSSRHAPHAAAVYPAHSVCRWSAALGECRIRWHAPRATAVLAFVLLFLPCRLPASTAASQDVWYVSTRSAPHNSCEAATLDKLGYWHLDEKCQWVAADQETFHAGDDTAVPTVVFFHGNRTDADESVMKAWYVYQTIQAQSGDRPMRFVIWSWPADQVLRLRPDAQLKASYCDVESYYLAQWLDGLKPGVKVSLSGHSFGPRIIAGALHLLAGGNVAGQAMPEATVAAWKDGRRNRVRAVMLAAGMDADCLAPCGCYGLALAITEQMLITCNPIDRALRRYPRLYGRRGPQAMGYVGPRGVGCYGNVEVVCVASRRHDWRNYVSAPNVCCRWARFAFLREP